MLKESANSHAHGEETNRPPARIRRHFPRIPAPTRLPKRQVHRIPTGPSGDRGEGSLEVVLVMPVLILLITSVIQFALWSHATHVAVAAAQEGAEQARLDGATAEEGKARAEDFLTQAGLRLIVGPEVTATRDAQVATVVVRGRVTSVVPGLELPVRGRATGVVERFRSAIEPLPDVGG
jgi:hypothetical protein